MTKTLLIRKSYNYDKIDCIIVWYLVCKPELPWEWEYPWGFPFPWDGNGNGKDFFPVGIPIGIPIGIPMGIPMGYSNTVSLGHP